MKNCIGSKTLFLGKIIFMNDEALNNPLSRNFRLAHKNRDDILACIDVLHGNPYQILGF